MSKEDLVVQKIRDRIAAGTLAPGQRLPAERLLSSEFKVSRQAIQAGLRELEALGLVLRAPNCRPIIAPTGTKPASSTRMGADQIAVWILPDLQDFGGTMILQGIRAAFGSENYRVLIGCPPSYETATLEQAEVEFLHSIEDNPRIAGAIIWDSGNLACIPVYRSLVKRGFPLVFIDREPPFEIAADVVSTNNPRAARSAVQYLLELGHRRIAMVVGKDRASSVTERIDGYRTALLQAELEPDPSLIFELPLLPSEAIHESSKRLLTQILDHPHAPSAIFAVNDRIAIHLADAAKALHIQVPGRLSIVGFDWIMRWLPSGGDLTTVAQRFDEIGRIAAERVLTRIQDGSVEASRHILLDTFLVQKHSAGVPFDSPIAKPPIHSTGEIHETAQSQRLHAH